MNSSSSQTNQQQSIYSSFNSSQFKRNIKYAPAKQKPIKPPRNLRDKLLVNNSVLISWLKKRNQTAAKSEYIMNKQQIIKEQEMNGVFKKFDMDKSGAIEIDELHTMFVNYGVDIEKSELKSLFKIVDEDGTGSLNLEEFKKFTLNPTANKLFRTIIQKIRDEQERYFGKGRIKGYLPFNLSRLLEYLSYQAKREYIHDNIESTKFKDFSTDSNIKNFIKLFILDGVSKDSLVKEESGKVIENNLIQRNKRLQVARKDTMVKISEKLQTLDDNILDEISENMINNQPSLRKYTLFNDQLKAKIEQIKLDQISEQTSFCTDSDSEISEKSDKDQYSASKQAQHIKDIIYQAQQRGKQSAYQEYSTHNLTTQSRQIGHSQGHVSISQDQSNISRERAVRIQSQRATIIKGNNEKENENNINRRNIRNLSSFYSMAQSRQDNSRGIIKGYHTHSRSNVQQKSQNLRESVENKKLLDKSDNGNNSQVRLPGIMKMKQTRYDQQTNKSLVMRTLLQNQDLSMI